MNPSRLIVLSLACLLTAACDRLGFPDPAKTAAQAEAEGKAIGGACRHAGRALEDCYQLNPTAPKAAIFTGWREMNDYMTENKIEVVPPQFPATLPSSTKKRAKTKPEAAAVEEHPEAAEDKGGSDRPTGGKHETEDAGSSDKGRRHKT